MDVWSWPIFTVHSTLRDRLLFGVDRPSRSSRQPRAAWSLMNLLAARYRRLALKPYCAMSPLQRASERWDYSETILKTSPP